MIFRLIVGFLAAGFGFVLAWKTVDFLDIVGRIDWAEEKLGPGGTTTFLKLLGIGFIFIGFVIMTNLHVGILQSFSSLFIRS